VVNKETAMEIAKNGTAFREIILGVLAYQYS
jgi:hypothetical protein